LINSGADGFDDPDNLMTGNYRKFFAAEISFDYVQISATDTTGMNLDEDFIIGRLGNRTIGKHERA